MPRFNAFLVVACLAVVAFSSSVSAEIKLIGSGASFPAPMYSKWFKDFSGANKGVRVDYQSNPSL